MSFGSQAFKALETTYLMQNFDTRKCPHVTRTEKNLIKCKVTGKLCYDRTNCPHKKECQVSKAMMVIRKDALNYRCMLQMTEKEKAYSREQKTWGLLLEEDPEFVYTQLIRPNTYGTLNDNLKFLSLEIVNALASKRYKELQGEQ